MMIDRSDDVRQIDNAIVAGSDDRVRVLFYLKVFNILETIQKAIPRLTKELDL